MRSTCKITRSNKSGHSVRLQRRTPNPFVRITDNYNKYGKYSYLFEEAEDPLKKFDDKRMLQSTQLLTIKVDKHQKHVMDSYWAERKAPFYNDYVTWVAPSATLSGTIGVC